MSPVSYNYQMISRNMPNTGAADTGDSIEPVLYRTGDLFNPDIASHWKTLQHLFPFWQGSCQEYDALSILNSRGNAGHFECHFWCISDDSFFPNPENRKINFHG